MMPTTSRVPMASAGALLLALTCLAPMPGHAKEVRAGASARVIVDATPQAHVDEALQRAGEHRDELARVLTHFAGHDDGRRLVAARFLIANMPWKGYIRTALQDEAGSTIPFDALAFDTFKDARVGIESLEASHGTLDWQRTNVIWDIETIRASFLIDHIHAAFAAWERTPPHRRVGFRPFLHYVLPYRGSEEPLDAWMRPLLRRYAPQVRGERANRSAQDIWKWIGREVGPRVRFDERYYLHPTDQSFTEMGRSGLGRCEDITNMQTYAARSLGVAVAADYTPYWAHQDNNHAWPVLLDKDGRGSVKSNAHAAKVYRKSFALVRNALACQLPEGRLAPNRFMMSRTALDVTDQYRTTHDVTATITEAEAQGERFAYICVFNAGAWRAIHWAPIVAGTATFDRMGGGIAYLVAIHKPDDSSEAGDRTLMGVGSPLILTKEGAVQRLTGNAAVTPLLAVATKPPQQNVDTLEVTPVSKLAPNTTYTLALWGDGGWQTIDEKTPTDTTPLTWSKKTPADGLYWLTAQGSRRLERIFTIEKGRQRFW